MNFIDKDLLIRVNWEPNVLKIFQVFIYFKMIYYKLGSEHFFEFTHHPLPTKPTGTESGKNLTTPKIAEKAEDQKILPGIISQVY
jgi:hypothetical protein